MNSSIYYSEKPLMSPSAQAVIYAVIIVIIAYFAYSYYVSSSQSFQSNPFIGSFDGMTPIPIFKGQFLPPNPFWQ